MTVVHAILLLLIATTPVVFLFGDLIAQGCVGLLVAVALATTALTLRPGEASHLIKTTRPALILVAIPVLYLVFQLLPLPASAVSRSIWESAGTTLNAGLWPRTTIDPGLTLVALYHTVVLIAVVFVAAAGSLDRPDAERTLLGVAVAAIIISAMQLVDRFANLSILNADTLAALRPAAQAASVCAVVLLSTITIMFIERYLTAPRGSHYLAIRLAITLVGWAIVALAMAAAGSIQTTFAAGCGMMTVLILFFVRRIGLGWRSTLVMGVIAIISTATVLVARSAPSEIDLSLKYSAATSAEQVSAADRIIRDVGLGGTGGGTFAAIYPIYATQDTARLPASAPTSAAQISIELGRPALWVIVALTILLIGWCARGAFDRGRDFFYPVAGAGMGVASLAIGFSTIGLQNPAIAILIATTFGLSFVQGARRAT